MQYKFVKNSFQKFFSNFFNLYHKNFFSTLFWKYLWNIIVVLFCHIDNIFSHLCIFFFHSHNFPLFPISHTFYSVLIIPFLTKNFFLLFLCNWNYLIWFLTCQSIVFKKRKKLYKNTFFSEILVPYQKSIYKRRIFMNKLYNTPENVQVIYERRKKITIYFRNYFNTVKIISLSRRDLSPSFSSVPGTSMVEGEKDSRNFSCP